MKLYTIGFTKKSLREFIQLLKDAGITLVVDIRLNNSSQLAGYSKGRDLEFLLQEGFGIKYRHELELAPTPDILKDYKQDNDWERYTEGFTRLFNQRPILKLGSELLKDETVCLLCSEALPDHCHRRLIAEFWARYLPDIEVEHL
ncbi:MAG: DUF488 domain-containing protein [bacterium]|nr:DUF488 domain-containing protein [bacterium]